MNWKLVIQSALTVAISGSTQYLTDGTWQSGVAAALVAVAALVKQSPLKK